MLLYNFNAKMLWSYFLLIAVYPYIVLSAPQFVSVKDGKVGVNFGGYHAEAGLGGLLGGGSGAQGGLSASAGTPFGQEAAAGLGGILNGRAAGSGYASATAGGNIGASAGLGSVLNGQNTDAGLGAEAHAGGYKHAIVENAGGNVQITKTIPKIAPPPVEFEGRANFEISGNSAVASTATAVDSEVVQKVKPHKKNHNQVVAAPTNVAPVIEKRKQVVVQSSPPVHVPAPAPVPFGAYSGSVQGRINADTGSFFDSIFNIPISTLKAVNGLLNSGIRGGGSIAVEKTGGFTLG